MNPQHKCFHACSFLPLNATRATVRLVTPTNWLEIPEICDLLFEMISVDNHRRVILISFLECSSE